MKILLIICPSARFILSTIVFALFAPLTMGQGRASGVDDLFRERVVETLSRSKQRELEALLQSARVGNRDERQAARRQLVGWGRRGETFLLKHLTSRRSADARCAAMVLSRSGGRRTLSLLRERIARRAKGRKQKEGDPQLEVRALGLLGESEDVALLLRLMRRERSAVGRRAVVHALGILQDASVVPLLLKEFETETSKESRCAVLNALSSIGSPRGRPAIQAGLSSHKTSVQVAAILAAASVGDGWLTPVILKRLGSKHASVIHAALLTLAHLKADKSLEVVIKRKLLRHRDRDVRHAAALLIGAVGDAKSVPVLRSRLIRSKEQDLSVRRALLFAWVRIGGSSDNKELRAFMKSLVADEAAAALLGLGTSSDALEESELTSIIGTSTDVMLFSAAAALLAHRFPESALAPLQSALASRSTPQTARSLLIRLVQLRKKTVGPSEEITAYLNTQLEKLGGSVDWQLALASHRVFLEAERLHHPLGSHSGSGAGSAGTPKPASRWTDVAEDHRLWLDDFPYYAQKREHPFFN